MTKFLKIIIREELKKILKEELKRGSRGHDVSNLQKKLISLKYLNIKAPTGYFGKLTNAAIKAFQKANNIPSTGIVDSQTSKLLELTDTEKKQVVKTQKNVCPKISGTSEQLQEYDQLSKQLMSAPSSVPTRSACEIAYVKIRPQYKNKSFFVVDTLQNLIYCYDKAGKLVGKSFIIDGKNAQSQNEKLIAQALLNSLDWQEQNGVIFKNGSYYDKSGKNLGPDAWYHYTDKTKARFIPKGIYSISEGISNKEYAGSGLNVFHLKKGDKELAQALHGFYKEPKRVEWMKQAKQKMGTNFDDPAVSKQYLDFIRKSTGLELGGNMSYGCINVPVQFLNLIRPYAVGSFIFVVSENQTNYLVQNSVDFFNKSFQQDDVKEYAELFPNKTPIQIQTQDPGKEEKAYA
jgi:hypothetical protein